MYTFYFSNNPIKCFNLLRKVKERKNGVLFIFSCFINRAKFGIRIRMSSGFAILLKISADTGLLARQL